MLKLAKKLKRNITENEELVKARNELVNLFDEKYGATHRDMFDTIPNSLVEHIRESNADPKYEHFFFINSLYELESVEFSDSQGKLLQILENIYKYHGMDTTLIAKKNKDESMKITNESAPYFDKEKYKNSELIYGRTTICYYGRYIKIRFEYYKKASGESTCVLTPCVELREYIPSLERAGFKFKYKRSKKEVLIKW